MLVGCEGEHLMATERRHRRHPTELKLRLVESYLNGEGSLKSIAGAHDITQPF